MDADHALTKQTLLSTHVRKVEKTTCVCVERGGGKLRSGGRDGHIRFNLFITT